ncbi:MAG: sugar phosphate isomerase/epimerase family protein [Acidobacteriota bacterium]
MRRLASVFAVVSVAMTAFGTQPVQAQEKVYAYCVELGVPGVTQRPVSELTRLVRESGFDGIGFPILVNPELDETLRASDEAGLKVYVLHVPIKFGPDGAQYDSRSRESILKLKGRPVTIVVTLGGLKPGDPEGMEPAVRALRELGDVAAQAGVRISLYNHLDTWNESVAQNIEVVRKVNHPQVGYNFNVSHWVPLEGDKDYRPLLRANADKLFCLIICGSQIGGKGQVLPLGQGNFDNRALLKSVREIGYKGPIGIMFYSIPGDPNDLLNQAMKTWKSWQPAW